MRAFSWHPWIPEALKLDSNSSLFKCVKGFFFFQMIDLSAYARTDLQEEIDQLEGKEASSQSKLSNIQSEVDEVQQDTSQLRDTLDKIDSRTKSEVAMIKEDIQQVNGSLWSNHRSTKGKKSS